MYILLLLITAALGIFIYSVKRKKTRLPPPSLPDDTRIHTLLEQHVHFYRNLDSGKQSLFRARVRHFLGSVAITGVGTVQLTELDRIYVAASAIIPIFSFSDWSYNNLNEVLVYADTFTRDFDMQSEDRNVLGMVGTGAMNRMMILSLPALRAGFEHNGAGNTAIHEFVHLLDKADGATDGVPEYMLPKDLVEPWIRYMRQAIAAIRSGASDVNPYAGTNEAEFFAVVSEYFFQKPHLLEAHHPELYRMLNKIYRPSGTS